jgi:hypothetical protein
VPKNARLIALAVKRYIGIDYSGAQTPSSSLKGLRVYAANGSNVPQEVLPPPSPRKYWTRRGVAEWLVEQLSEHTQTLVGIDHGFSFPLQYFENYGLPLNWPSFLDDFQRHWPTDEDIYVDFVRDGCTGNGAARSGNTRWRRITELRARTAKSVFQFDVQGSVAKSTHGVSRGCATFANTCETASTFGRSTAGASRRSVRSSRRSTLHCGAGVSRVRGGRRISRMRSLWRSGCKKRIATARSKNTCTLVSNRLSAQRRKSKAGFSEFCSQPLDHAVFAHSRSLSSLRKATATSNGSTAA